MVGGPALNEDTSERGDVEVEDNSKTESFGTWNENLKKKKLQIFLH